MNNIQRRDRLWILVLWGLCAVPMLFGCKTAVRAPRRPASVPAVAVWVGGQDGGAWISCGIDQEKDVNHCTVYNDSTGSVWVSGAFVLRGENRAAAAAELTYNAFDGTLILLEGGRVLEPTPR